jgi:hypothetical protein
VESAAVDVPGALGAASLVALARWLGSAPRESIESIALACAGDDGGAGAAALVAAG